MPKNINPIRKALLKKSLKAGQSQAQALRDAGFAESTAHSRVGDLPSLKIVKAEIAQELRYCDITPDLMIRRFDEDRAMAQAKGDIATATRVDELMSKSIAMLTERVEISAAENPDNQFRTERLSRLSVNNSVDNQIVNRAVQPALTQDIGKQ